jgi:ATP/maltotriose-dependent transcriptional regulator MalT
MDPDRSFVTACFDATKGNPLFFRELLATVKAEGIAPTASEASRVLEVAPESIARSVSRRMRRLAPEAADLARAIAVLGDGAELPTAAQLAGLDSVDAAAAAVALGWAEILTVEGLEFVHPVVRAAVYSELSPVERADQHRKAATLLAELGADEDTVALHLLSGEPSRSSWVVDILRRAARRAHSRGAPDVAVTYLQRALSEPPPAAERVEITVELGLAELAALNFVTGLARMREAVDRTEDRTARAQVALQLAQSLFIVGALPDAAQVLEETLAESEGADADLTERLEAELISLGLAVPTLTARVVDRLDRLHDRRAEVHDPILLAALAADTATTRGPPRDALALAERSLSGSNLSVVDNPTVVGLAASTFIALDRLDRAKEILDQALVEARRRGSFFALGFAWSLRALVLVRLGALAAAEADTRNALDPLSSEARMAAPWLVPPLTDVQLERGELEAASRLLDEYGLGGDLPDLLQMNQLLETRGRLRLAQNRVNEGIADLRECARRLAAWGHGVRNPGLIPWGPSLASALAATGEQDEARTLAREQVDLAREFEVPRELGMALRVTGLVEGGDDGIELLREAVEVLEPTAFELEHARALTDFGAAIRRRGHRSDAREPLRGGLDLARRCGATELAERAHRELVATGARPRRLTLSGVDSLTASERRVADLAAEGLTNREVAQALFVTEKTVEGHLAGCYRKLDISSRSELPHALGRPPELARR